MLSKCDHRNSILSMPYLSIVLALRNDDYGGQLLNRVQRYISHLARGLGDGSDDLYELVVVDWNPPSGSKPIREALDWSVARHVKHISVTQEVHESIRERALIQRPMYDYLARIVGVSESSGAFVAITNQDVLWSAAIFSFVKRKQFCKGCFYRADRLDTEILETSASLSDQDLLARAIRVHRRHASGNPLSAPVNESGKVEDLLSRPIKRRSRGSVEIGPSNRNLLSMWYLKQAQISGAFEDLLANLGLHTNASGDFLVASKEFLLPTSPSRESLDFYLHLDTYWVCRMWALGLRQALFTNPGYVFHVGHETTDHLSKESYDWDWHRRQLMDILVTPLSTTTGLSASDSRPSFLEGSRRVVYGA